MLDKDTFLYCYLEIIIIDDKWDGLVLYIASIVPPYAMTTNSICLEGKIQFFSQTNIDFRFLPTKDVM